MKKIYISELSGQSGICRYSKDFFYLVMQPAGFEFVNSDEEIVEILAMICSDDIVHLEIGLNRNREIEILLALIKLDHPNLSITLHDPPRLKYPYYQFSVPILNKVSKFVDLYFDNFGVNKRLFRKIKKIYVLNNLSKGILESKFNLSNVTYIPLILCQQEILNEPLVENNNFLFFGFLGKNKGIERALELHREIMVTHPDSKFYIVGGALSITVQQYIDKLQKRFEKNTYFLGFVPFEKLDDVFKLANYVFLPFQYRAFINPTSASLLTALKYNKIVFTNKVNAVPEIITDGVTGYFLPADLLKSAAFILEKMKDKDKLLAIKQNVALQLNVGFTQASISSLFHD